jgi:hypothetical protein
MKTYLQRHLEKIQHLAAALLLACMALLAGCGADTGNGTAGVGTGGTGTIRYAMAGFVADGYLANAVVILDKNGNYQLDPGEPYAITDENGAYTLEVNAADVGNFPIVAMAIRGLTVDRDDNLPVANSYVLSLAKENVHGVANNFISPISSQLRTLMETGKYISIYEAAEALKKQMGLPATTNLLADYVAAGDRKVHAAAQNIAAVMGSQASHVVTVDGPVLEVDAKRYQCMMAAINNNVSAVVDGNSQELARQIALEILKCSDPLW